MLTKIDKAITAAASTGVLVYTSLQVGGGHLEQAVALGAAVGAGLVAGALVFLVPNKAN